MSKTNRGLVGLIVGLVVGVSLGPAVAVPAAQHLIPPGMETVSLKLTKPQVRALEKAAKERGFPSKSEFVRYALARALEEELDVKTIEEIFETRRQVREGRTVPLERLAAEG